ncbi:hypothetical protein BB561_001248 [Smittium simulii]|uniref:Integrase zinc-binding domain-containing protein n=1 Tax=Smittium simulii TaxID=133385 RepID=A0A2T9YVG3_9FUNG|nr:hypothetical protein BB561_001248 [Smittium simulii]
MLEKKLNLNAYIETNPNECKFATNLDIDFKDKNLKTKLLNVEHIDTNKRITLGSLATTYPNFSYRNLEIQGILLKALLNSVPKENNAVTADGKEFKIKQQTEINLQFEDTKIPTTAHPHGRLARWLEKYQHLKPNLIYYPGIRNNAADALSRRFDLVNIAISNNNEFKTTDLEKNIKKNEQIDINYIENFNNTVYMRDESQEYFYALVKLAIENPIIIPERAKIYIWQKALAEKIKWPEMRDTITKIINQCPQCQITGKSQNTIAALNPLQPEDGPFTRWVIDFIRQFSASTKGTNQAVWATRIRDHSITKISPYFLVYGANPRIPGDNMPLGNNNTSEAINFKNISNRLTDYTICSWVMLKTETQQKLNPKFFDPFKIIYHVPFYAYKLKTVKDKTLKVLVNHNCLQLTFLEDEIINRPWKKSQGRLI